MSDQCIKDLSLEYANVHKEVECLRTRVRSARKSLQEGINLLDEVESGVDRAAARPKDTMPYHVDLDIAAAVNQIASDLNSKMAEKADLKTRLTRLGFPFED